MHYFILVLLFFISWVCFNLAGKVGDMKDIHSTTLLEWLFGIFQTGWVVFIGLFMWQLVKK